jgi:aminopeptidase N
MKKLIFLAGITAILFSSAVCSQNPLETTYDVKQYILDLKLDNMSASISGNVTIIAMVTSASLDTFAVDLIDNIITGYVYMVVDSLFISGIHHEFVHNNKIIKVPFDNPLSSGQTFSAKIYYHGKGPFGNNGGIQITSYNNKKFAATWSEPYGSAYWWPCKQDPSDKADSSIFYITTRTSNRSGSNGLLTSVDTLEGDTLVRYKWVTRYPIDYYLVSFAVGPFDQYITYAFLQNGGDSVFMQNLLLNDAPDYQRQMQAINKTKDLISFYSTILCDYPFKDEKFGYSIIYGGGGTMENQTMCTMGRLYMDTTFVKYGSGHWFLTAHELGHQWFGDYVTCADWNDLWLNEGFASYMEYLALQNLESQHSADIWLQDAHAEILMHSGGRIYGSWDYMPVYKKSSAMIHMLRYEINNDSIFFLILKNYLETYRYSVANTADFKFLAEIISGLDLSDFFTQWYYGEGWPSFEITWNQSGDTVTIISNQTTSTAAMTLFKTHFDLKIHYMAGDTIVRLFQASNSDTFRIYFHLKADSIEFDPENHLIQKHSIRLGIEENRNSSLFTVIPNPADRRITVDVRSNILSGSPLISIYNIPGQLLQQQKLTREETDVDISSFPNGIYLIKMSCDKDTGVLRFVKD